METLNEFLEQHENLTALQMCIRAAFVFLVTLCIIRIGGVRIFRNRSAFDIIIMISMGSVLARGIVGASPLLSTIAAAVTMLLIHRGIGWLSVRSSSFEALLKGKRKILYQDGQFVQKNLQRTSLSRNDIMESLHLETGETTLENIDYATLETNGRISFKMKSKKN